MGLAQTAELAVIIAGKDLLSPAVHSAEASLSGLNKTAAGTSAITGTATKAMGLVGTAATGMGNALNHAKGFLGGLISGPLGLIGLGGAAFGAAGFLKSAIDKVSELGVQVEKLTTLTGLSVPAASALLAVFAKFGLNADAATMAIARLDKNAFTLNETAKKAAAFQAKFGVSLVDASGHLKDTNTLLGIAADYLNGNSSAAQKAAFESALFGRSWQTMIPLLKLGSQGLADAEKQAADLGLTLSDTNEQDLLTFHKSLQTLQQTIGGLTLALGIDLIPTLNDMATAFAKFATDHRTDIVAFFKNAITFGRQVGAAFVSIGKLAVGAWNSIPGPLRDLMLQALVGNKVIKTVFGINILGSVEGAVADVGKSVLSKIVGGLFGKTIATPVVNVDGAVVNVAGGGLGGAAGGAAGGAEAGGAGAVAGGIGLAGVAAIAASVVASAAVAAAIIGIVYKVSGITPAEIHKANTSGQFGPRSADNVTALSKAIQQGDTKLTNLQQIQNTILTQGAAHAAQAAQTANEDSQHLRLAMQSAAQGAAAHAALLKAALVNLSGLTKAQLAIVAHNIQLETVAAASHFKLTYSELLHKSHIDHLDHISTLAKFDHLTIQQELAKQATLALRPPLLAINATLIAIGHGGGGLAAGGGSGMGGRGGSQSNQGGKTVVVTHRSNTAAGTSAKHYGAR